MEDVGAVAVTMCDTTPRQLLRLAGHRLHSVDRHRFARFRPGPGIFKVDYALSEPIPWRAKDCALAATVHVGGDDDGDCRVGIRGGAWQHGELARS